jgi:hypothetical protein
MKGEGKGWLGAKDWWNGAKGSSWWEHCEARFLTVEEVDKQRRKDLQLQHDDGQWR